MSNDQPNISIGNVSGGQNNIGKTEIAGDQVQNNHFASNVPTPDVVFDSIEKSLKDLPSEELKKVKEEALDPLREIAKKPEAEQKKPGVKEKAMGLINKVSPYAPTIGKALLAFGEQSLETLASTNPVVSGLLAMVKAFKGPIEKKLEAKKTTPAPKK